jgi:hypothetical protein
VDSELERLSAQFDGPLAERFPTSPLYNVLRHTVAAQPTILQMLVHRRPGQQAPYLFFGAVQYLLLRGVPHPLRTFYPSVVGPRSREPEQAGPALIDFCRTYRDELGQQIQTRLVQTNVVRRVIGLRIALAEIAKTSPAPIHLIEVGASAGVHLHADRYRYLIGDRTYGRPGATVTVDSRWIGAHPPPDLDPIPPIATRVGIDLNPVPATDSDQRRWLRALVWPENQADAHLLETALTSLAADPPAIIAGDAAEVCPKLGRDLPRGEPRIVFHAATRMHVPRSGRAAFDAAIDSIGDAGPLFHAWQEPAIAPHHRCRADERPVLVMHGPGRSQAEPLVQIDGHGQWVAALDAVAPPSPGSPYRGGSHRRRAE